MFPIDKERCNQFLDVRNDVVATVHGYKQGARGFPGLLLSCWNVHGSTFDDGLDDRVGMWENDLERITVALKGQRHPSILSLQDLNVSFERRQLLEEAVQFATPFGCCHE